MGGHPGRHRTGTGREEEEPGGYSEEEADRGWWEEVAVEGRGRLQGEDWGWEESV